MVMAVKGTAVCFFFFFKVSQVVASCTFETENLHVQALMFSVVSGNFFWERAI